MPNRAFQEITRAVARFLTSVFFRDVLVEGIDTIPREGPLIYAVNHANAMVDPILIHGLLPRHPRFLAKHSLWDIAVLRPFLRMAGSIPVFRKQDRGSRMARNLETFDACYEALARGAVVGIFPEGLSHSEPSMMPIKTGIARIVIGAEEKHGPLGIAIVPVGLTFDARHLFRSRVLLNVGKTIGPVADVPRDKSEMRRARNDLTRQVDESLRRVTLNYGSWKEARLLERAGDLYAKTPSELPNRLGLSDLFEVRRQFVDGYEVIKKRLPERVAALARDVEAYDRMLRYSGFSDEQIVSHYPGSQVVGYVMRTLGRLFFYFPVAAAGMLLNWAPYRLTGRIAKPYAEKPDQSATRKIIGGFFVYPLAWALEAVLAGLLLGWRWALAMIIISPPTAWIAMRFKEESESFLAESYNYLRLRTHRQAWQQLRRRRMALSDEIASLADEYLEPDGS